MRTTVNIDEDVLAAAKALARSRSISLGAAVSELMRRGLSVRRQVRGRARGAFPTFDVPPDARPLSLDVVQEALEEE